MLKYIKCLTWPLRCPTENRALKKIKNKKKNHRLSCMPKERQEWWKGDQGRSALTEIILPARTKHFKEWVLPSLSEIHCCEQCQHQAIYSLVSHPNRTEVVQISSCLPSAETTGQSLGIPWLCWDHPASATTSQEREGNSQMPELDWSPPRLPSLRMATQG